MGMGLRLRIAVLIGLSGTAFILFFILVDRQGAGSPEFGLSTWWLCGAAFLGATVSGACFANMFGRPDRDAGWFIALGGYVASTALGAFLAGSLVIPGLGSLIAPLFVLGVFRDLPLSIVLWVSMFVLIQLRARTMRRKTGDPNP